MSEVLENIVWHTLIGPQAHFAEGSGSVRRYARGFSPVVAFEDQSNPKFELLSQFCSVGESFYCEGWTGTPPDNWNIDVDSLMVKMIYQGSRPPDVELDDMVSLRPDHAERAVELAKLTNPGPFGLRTMELGEYFAYFDRDKLISMTGERFQAGHYREVSGVCTHPDYQGRGLARNLMNEVLRRQLDRGQVPFLHVMSANEIARSLYLKMGFSVYHERTVRIVTRIH
jgi:ribosomal protein S18 acetylase RimI-like enzyme